MSTQLSFPMARILTHSEAQKHVISLFKIVLLLLLLFPYFSPLFIPGVSSELQDRGIGKTLAWSSQNKVTHFFKDEQNEGYDTYVKVTCTR